MVLDCLKSLLFSIHIAHRHLLIEGYVMSITALICLCDIRSLVLCLLSHLIANMLLVTLHFSKVK